MHSPDPVVQAAFTRTLAVLEDLMRRSVPARRAKLRAALATLREVMPEAEAADEVPPLALDDPPPLRLAAGIVEPTSHKKAVLKAWGADLERRRRAHGMSRKVLAERAGISESTLRNVEKAHRPPSRTTLMHLQSVPELRIDSSPINPHVHSRRQPPTEFAPNCWLAPEYDALKLYRDLSLQLNGRGGHIEQTYLYLDPTSATAWSAFAEQESYRRVRSAMQLAQVAEQIACVAGPVGLDILGLGCGDGLDEVRLTQCLLDRHPNHNLRLYLLDISQPLCSTAYRNAAEALADHRTVSTYAIQGNFRNLQQYSTLLASPENSHRRRIVTMFGNTFANLLNELMFVRGSLVGFAPGDFFLMTVPIAMAPADRPDEILRNDPRLSGRIASSTGLSKHDAQLVSMLRHHIPGVASVELSSVLDRDTCSVPGSYAADVRAVVKTFAGEEKQFSVYYAKRYDRALLDEKMANEGWQPIANWRFAEQYHPCLLLLYQRVRHPGTSH